MVEPLRCPQGHTGPFEFAELEWVYYEMIPNDDGTYSFGDHEHSEGSEQERMIACQHLDERGVNCGVEFPWPAGFGELIA